MAYEDLDDFSVGNAGSDTFDVVIPDLDPGKSFPVQFAWKYKDGSTGLYSTSYILNTPQVARPESTNIVAQWVTNDRGVQLEITWDAPALANGFTAYLTGTPEGFSTATVPFAHSLDKTKTQQKLVIPSQMIRDNFSGVFVTTLTGLLKTTYIDTSTTGATFVIPPYGDPLAGSAISDASWKITQVDKGFSVTWDAIATNGTYWETVVYKSSTISGTYIAVGSARNAPVFIEEINTVYIKIRHRLITGEYSAYSNYKVGAAYVPIVFDTTPPNDLTGVSAAWSNDDIIVSYTMPTSDPGARFEIVLTNGGVSRTFFKWPSSQTGTGSVKITDSELFAQFGERYTSYTGLIKSIDGGENQTSGVSFTVASKSNPLASITPTFTVTQISNGYTVVYSLPSGASYAKVYQGATSGFTPNDSTNLVYSGASPGVVINTTYSEVFIKIKYFAIDGSSSLSSAALAVTPLEAGLLSLIDNEVKISTNGSILAGDSATSGGRALLNKTGLYVYNTGSSPTTQIIANATDGSPTLITTNAKIADWMIYSSKIENTLHAGTTKYTGLSPSGTYAFWAGSTTAGGDSSAKFSVTPEGAVIARNISVYGGTLSVGANFDVTSSGVLTATSANITGTINAQSGVFKGTVDVGDATETAGVLRVVSGTGTILIGKNALIGGTATAGITASSTVDSVTTTNFYVRASDGYMFSQSGKIGGWDIGTSKLSGGGGASAVGLQISATAGGYAFWAGAGTPDANTPFSVTNTGVLRATGATISGAITVTSGKIGNQTSGWNINGNTLESYGFPSGTSQLILNSSTGTISGGLISGATVRGSVLETAESGTRVKIDGPSKPGTVQLFANGFATAGLIDVSGSWSETGTTIGQLVITPPIATGQSAPSLEMYSSDGGGFAWINSGTVILGDSAISSGGVLHGSWTLYQFDNTASGINRAIDKQLRNIAAFQGSGPPSSSLAGYGIGDIILFYA
jgi:hypothetical protein